MPLTIIAQIKAKPEHKAKVKSELLKLIPLTRAEEGCLNYDLHQDNDDAGFFVFHENWETRDRWQVHMNAGHMQTYVENTDGMVADFVLHEMTQID